MKKIFKKLHLWLSVPFGLVITIICFTGAALVFETEITEMSNRGRYYVDQVGESPIPVGQLLEKVAASLPDSVSVTNVTIPSDPRRTYQAGLSKPRRASVFVDQYTGEVKDNYQRGKFFTTMLRLHRWLLDGMKPGGGISAGKLIVGISTIIFVIVLITGIIIWIPRSRKALKQSLKISVHKGRKRFWYDLHVAGGMYAVILLLTMALTGLTWSFSWYRTGFYRVFGSKTQQTQPHQPQQPQNNQGGQSARMENTGGGEHGEGQRGNRHAASPYLHWQDVYDNLSAENPDFKSISLSGGAASMSYKRWGNQRASDRYTFDNATGQITGTSFYKEQPKANKLRGWIYSVHVGSWGGIFSKIITFLAAVLGGSLPLTGYYLWIKRWLNRRRARKIPAVQPA